MKKNKILKIMALTLALSSIGTVTAFADGGSWQQLNNNWYYKDNLTGRMETGWIQDNGHWYYLDSSEIMKTGWIYDSGNWFYLYGDGTMAHDASINGYYLNNDGNWTDDIGANTSSGTSLNWRDTEGPHEIKDAAPRQIDYDASALALYKNVDLSDSGISAMKGLFYQLGNERLYLPEAKYQCIGKVVDGKYFINDIKFFQKDLDRGGYPNAMDAQTIANFLKQSSLYDYKSTAPYVYDTSIGQLVGNGNTHWEIIRMVVEFGSV